MDKEEMAKILKVLRISYPNAFKNFTKDDMFVMLNLWHKEFGHLRSEVLENIIMELIRKEDFMPSISKVWTEIKIYKENLVKIKKEKELLKKGFIDDDEYFLMYEEAKQEMGFQNALSQQILEGGGFIEN